jgi:hypothetical protein
MGSIWEKKNGNRFGSEDGDSFGFPAMLVAAYVVL